MVRPAVDTSALVELIKRDPDKLAEFLQRNPGVAQTLSGVYGQSSGALESDLRIGFISLPPEPALSYTFRELVKLHHGTLEARVGTRSTYVFRLTLEDVKPDQTQNKLEALVEEINGNFHTLPNYPSVRGFKVYLSGNGDLPNYDRAGNVVFTCSSVIYDSQDRDLKETTYSRGIEHRSSQQALLSDLGLVEQPNDVVRVIAGMFRIAWGFPVNQKDIGTQCDRGDVFAGKLARTKQGPRSGCVATHDDGVFGSLWNLRIEAHPDIGCVGGDPAKLIIL
jgi:hypothetical protein